MSPTMTQKKLGPKNVPDIYVSLFAVCMFYKVSHISTLKIPAAVFRSSIPDLVSCSHLSLTVRTQLLLEKREGEAVDGWGEGRGVSGDRG